jgi:hypothetical protein
MIAFGKSIGIKFLAYAYPTLPFMGAGALPIDEGMVLFPF